MVQTERTRVRSWKPQPRARRLHLREWISERSRPSVFVLTYATEHLWIRDHFAGLREVNTSQNELRS